MSQNLFKTTLLNHSLLVHQRMDELLCNDFSDTKLVEAMRYSALSDGKKLRPFLIVVSAQIFGVDPSQCLNAAAAIEFLHVYSLIHDDLPAMDNDDIRRGKPTSHKKFGVALSGGTYRRQLDDLQRDFSARSLLNHFNWVTHLITRINCYF
jgi:geranylgeranyl pyrophosphate synthase